MTARSLDAITSTGQPDKRSPISGELAAANGGRSAGL